MGHIRKAVVIGAGITGLACAYRLQQLGIEPLVLESSNRAGGVISTTRRNGFLFESGPQIPRFPAPLWSLVRALNIEKDFISGNSRAKRYILKNNRLEGAPFSPMGLLATGLISWRSKYRILTEPFRTSHPPPAEETLAQFVRRKFGSEILDYLVDPIISTVFFGDADKMGMESAFPTLVQWERQSGSLARGAIRSRHSKRPVESFDPLTANRSGLHVTGALPSLGSFTLGLETLTEQLSERLRSSIRYGAEVESVATSLSQPVGNRCGWQVSLRGGEQILAEELAMAVPADVAATLLERSAPRVSSLLSEIDYASIAVVGLAFDRAQVSHPLDGFGFMVPRSERLHIICTFWNSSLFKGRAPEGDILITSFVRCEPDTRLLGMPDLELARIVKTENARILSIRGEPIDCVVRKYRRALPQYNVGHTRRVAEICDALQTLKNLCLAGNFLAGRSIGDCVASGFRAAEEVHSRLHV